MLSLDKQASLWFILANILKVTTSVFHIFLIHAIFKKNIQCNDMIFVYK